MREFRESCFGLIRVLLIEDLGLIRDVSMFLHSIIKGQDRLFQDIFSEIGNFYIKLYKQP